MAARSEINFGRFDLVGDGVAGPRERGDAALGADQLVFLEPLEDALDLRLVGIAGRRAPAAGVGLGPCSSQTNRSPICSASSRSAIDSVILDSFRVRAGAEVATFPRLAFGVS